MKCLTHCTSFINALHILLEGKVKFGNIRHSNDKCEADLIKDDITSVTLYFFSLFIGTCDDIGSLMWLAYCGRTNGTSITFCFNDCTDFEELFYKDADIFGFPIIYKDNDLEVIGDDCSLTGHVKNSKFEAEKEYRFLIEKSYTDEIGSIYKEINFGCLDKIVLCVGPDLATICKKIFSGNNLVEVKVNDYIQ